jgi:hypothetical protein
MQPKLRGVQFFAACIPESRTETIPAPQALIFVCADTALTVI